MSIKINYLNKTGSLSSSNLVCLLMKNLIFRVKENLSDTEYSYINDLLKTSDLKKIYLF